MNKLTLFLVFILSISFSHLHSQAWAYTCGFTAGDGSYVSGNYYEIDLSTGAGTLLGPASGDCAIGDQILSGEWVDGTYYSLDNGAGVPELLSVDGTGTCTSVALVTGLNAGHTVTGLSHDLSSGTTYILTTSGTVSTLYTLDINTGVATVIGDTGANSPQAITLAIDGSGNGFIMDLQSDAIHPIDLTTGLAGPGVPLTDGINPIGLNFAQDSDFDCDEDTGMLFGVLYSGGGTGRFGTLDPLTGVFTEIFFIGTEICGFSINTQLPQPPPIPTLSEWGLIVLLISLSIVGIVGIRTYIKQPAVSRIS